MQKKSSIFIRSLNKVIYLLLIFSFQKPVLAVNGLIPLDDTKIKLSHRRTLLTKRIDYHSHYVILKEDSKILWKKKFHMEYDRLWSYAFFVPIKKGTYEFDVNKDGYPEIAIATWDGGVNMRGRTALIFTVNNKGLEYFTKKKFNLEFGTHVYPSDNDKAPKTLKSFDRIADAKGRIKGGAAIFTLKEVKRQIRTILGEKKYKEFLTIEGFGPQTTVERLKNFLYFTVCEAHNCGHTFYFFIDLKLSTIFICERDMDVPGKDKHSAVKVWANWYGPRGHIKRKGKQCEIYDEKAEQIDWEKTFSSIPKEIW